MLLKLSLNHLNCLSPIKGLVALKAVLLQDAMRGYKIEVVMIDEKYSRIFLEIEGKRLFVLILVFFRILHLLIDPQGTFDSQGTFRWTLLCDTSSSFWLFVALLC